RLVAVILIRTRCTRDERSMKPKCGRSHGMPGQFYEEIPTSWNGFRQLRWRCDVWSTRIEAELSYCWGAVSTTWNDAGESNTVSRRDDARRYGVQGDLRWAAIIAANPIEGDRVFPRIFIRGRELEALDMVTVARQSYVVETVANQRVWCIFSSPAGSRMTQDVPVVFDHRSIGSIGQVWWEQRLSDAKNPQRFAEFDILRLPKIDDCLFANSLFHVIRKCPKLNAECGVGSTGLEFRTYYSSSAVHIQWPCRDLNSGTITPEQEDDRSNECGVNMNETDIRRKIPVNREDRIHFAPSFSGMINGQVSRVTEENNGFKETCAGSGHNDGTKQRIVENGLDNDKVISGAYTWPFRTSVMERYCTNMCSLHVQNSRCVPGLEVRSLLIVPLCFQSYFKRVAYRTARNPKKFELRSVVIYASVSEPLRLCPPRLEPELELELEREPFLSLEPCFFLSIVSTCAITTYQLYTTRDDLENHQYSGKRQTLND
ncbi:hypothetical protein CLF_109336, partial [Clonorchis sinensis]